jgi:hypothetical protein
MNEQKSEVAQLLQRISLEYEAAQRGLTGLSAGALSTALSSPGWSRSRPITSNSPALSAKREQHNLSSSWQKRFHPRKTRQVDHLIPGLVRQGDCKAVRTSEHESASLVAFVPG